MQTNEQRSVLVVDDDGFILAITRQMLEDLGYAFILTAESAEQALALIRAADPPVGLVLSDLNMPDIDGVELLRLFVEKGYEGDIVLFSGEDDRTLSMAVNLARARNLSVLGAISKPLEATALADVLARRTSARKMVQRGPARQVSTEILAEAIDMEELVPWYQPKIDIASKAVVGFEALARWPRAEGMIFPDVFVPLAEENGLVDSMTFLLVKQVVRMSKLWRSQDITAKVAVNVSMDSLRHLDFTDLLDKVIQLEGGKTSSYQLEITESRLMSDYVSVLDVLLRLRLKKIRLSIDDFGTGHSTLGQLRDLPFDELKLDRSYVQGAGKDPKTKAILESSVEMAKKLDIEIVAEGVETLEDWKLVEQLGCDQVQGYFVSRPMPGEDIPNWVASWPERCKSLFS